MKFNFSLIYLKSHFIRTNTPHPKELMKKKEMLKQRNANNPSVLSNSSVTNNNNTNSARNSQIESEPTSSSTQFTSTNNTNNVNIQLPVIENNVNLNEQNNSKPIASSQQHVIKTQEKVITQLKKGSSTSDSIDSSSIATVVASKKISERHNSGSERDDKINSIESSQTNKNTIINKHVDFKLNETKVVVAQNSIETTTSERNESSNQEGDNEDDDDDDDQEEDEAPHVPPAQLAHDLNLSGSGSESGNCRLRRRDTPHHLKGARVNTSNNKAQQLDPNEMKEILERYTNKSSTGNSPVSAKFNTNNSYQASFVKPKVCTFK